MVLDATFTRQENRLLAKETAESAGKKFIIVEVTCDENVVEQRIKARISDESDAGFETYLAYKKLFEPVTEDHFNIDNSASTEQTDKQIVALLTSCNCL